MGGFWRSFYAAIALIATLALAVIAYKLSFGAAAENPTQPSTGIDYTNFVVILLTTVTVIFSVCALVLAILGIVGFRSLKKEAGKFASQQALAEIAAAFDEGGRAQLQIRKEFTDPDGHLKKWAEGRIRKEVIELLPLITDRLSRNPPDLGLDEDAPTDEGDVD
jgi:hypothetical protein